MHIFRMMSYVLPISYIFLYEYILKTSQFGNGMNYTHLLLRVIRPREAAVFSTIL